MNGNEWQGLSLYMNNVFVLRRTLRANMHTLVSKIEK